MIPVSSLRIAVLSDLHGNYHALTTCLENALSLGCTEFWFLGDYVGEFAYPQKTMELLYRLQKEYPCTFIRGNKEDYWIRQKKNPAPWKDYDSTTGSLCYTYARLTDRDMDFFEALPIYRVIERDGCEPITLCHASTVCNNRKLLPDDPDSLTAIEQCSTKLLLCGHSHERKTFSHAGVTVCDIGAVGVPVGSNGRTQYALLTYKDGWKIQSIDLDYDRDAAMHDLDEERLTEHAPSWCEITKHLICEGKHMHATVLQEAIAHCTKRTGGCIWPDIPEEDWQAAIHSFWPQTDIRRTTE